MIQASARQVRRVARRGSEYTDDVRGQLMRWTWSAKATPPLFDRVPNAIRRLMIAAGLVDRGIGELGIGRAG